MIAAFMRRRREAKTARQAAIGRAADALIRFNHDDLRRAFWRAHDRAVRLDQSRTDRRYWRDVLTELGRRLPSSRPRADTATRMLFRD